MAWGRGIYGQNIIKLKFVLNTKNSLLVAKNFYNFS